MNQFVGLLQSGDENFEKEKDLNWNQILKGQKGLQIPLNFVTLCGLFLYMISIQV